MNQCSTCHANCSSDGFLPLWIIKICDDGLSAKLSAGLGRRARYVTLSYRWGSMVRYKMTSANRSDLQQQIPLCQIPRTFVDAIRVTRELGYSYLWIDALCITQDSETELEAQIAAMQDIYSNSDLTLFAATGDDAGAGLDRDRDVVLVRPIQVNVEVQLEPDSAAIGLTYFLKGPLGGTQMQDLPLFRRGWVLQEQLLSRRSLIFTEHEIRWRCLCSDLSEQIPFHCFQPDSWLHPFEPDYHRLMMMVRNWICTNNVNEFGKYLSPMDAFHAIIQNYSQRRLTFTSDVLPAISGLLSVYERRLGKHFISGICFEDITGFLWFIYYPDKRATSGHVLGQPSWSWTSRFGDSIDFRPADSVAAGGEIDMFNTMQVHLTSGKSATNNQITVMSWTRWANLDKRRDTQLRVHRFEIYPRDQKNRSELECRLDSEEWATYKSPTTICRVLCILVAGTSRWRDRRSDYYIVARPHADIPDCFTRIGLAWETYNGPEGRLMGDMQERNAVSESQRRTADGADYTIQYLV